MKPHFTFKYISDGTWVCFWYSQRFRIFHWNRSVGSIRDCLECASDFYGSFPIKKD